jgi:hypothetical protein
MKTICLLALVMVCFMASQSAGEIIYKDQKLRESEERQAMANASFGWAIGGGIAIAGLAIAFAIYKKK